MKLQKGKLTPTGALRIGLLHYHGGEVAERFKRFSDPYPKKGFKKRRVGIKLVNYYTNFPKDLYKKLNYFLPHLGYRVVAIRETDRCMSYYGHLFNGTRFILEEI